MLIQKILHNLYQDYLEDPQFHWEYLNYEIRKCSFIFQKKLHKTRKLKEFP